MCSAQCLPEDEMTITDWKPNLPIGYRSRVPDAISLGPVPQPDITNLLVWHVVPYGAIWLLVTNTISDWQSWRDPVVCPSAGSEHKNSRALNTGRVPPFLQRPGSFYFGPSRG